jgi:hypothetical protein
VVKVYNFCRVFKTNRLVVLTVMSGLDPHMTNLRKSVINLMHPSLFMLFMLIVGLVQPYTC